MTLTGFIILFVLITAVLLRPPRLTVVLIQVALVAR